MSLRLRRCRALGAAAAALLVARTWLCVAPGRAVRWGSNAAETVRDARHPRPVRDPRPLETIRDLSAAVSAIGRRAPFAATCLEQGLALVMLLTLVRIPAHLVLGVSRAALALSAHAWVESGGAVHHGAGVLFPGCLLVSRVIDEHRLYLRDRHRVSAYDRALREVVRPGDIVVDLASGTGILGMLACRAGARRVYAIEEGGIAGLARQIARANGFDDRITSVRGNSRLVTLPERADVVVCDQIGGFGLEAGVFELAKDVRQRFLRPGGTLIPSAVELVVAPVEHAGLHGRLRFWKGRPADFDCSAAVEIAANTGYPARLLPGHLLAPPVQAATIALSVETPLPLQLGAALHASRDGVLHGIAGWFVARLSPHVTMTNSPLSAERIYRRQVFFPIAEPVPIRAGSAISVSMRILPADTMYAWDVRVEPVSGPPVAFRHTTLRGMLLAREDLVHTNPAHRPRLTAPGVARLTVLRLCDGDRALADIERTVYEEHTDLFASPEEAAMFVAEVVTRYGR